MEHDSAAAAVLQLLSNRSLPEVGQLPVLLGAVPMLERQELPPLFGIEDTQQLLTHLQVKIFPSMGQGVCLKSCITNKPAHCLTYLEHGLTEILHGPSMLSGYLTLPPVFDMSLYNC